MTPITQAGRLSVDALADFTGLGVHERDSTSLCAWTALPYFLSRPFMTTSRAWIILLAMPKSELRLLIALAVCAALICAGYRVRNYLKIQSYLNQKSSMLVHPRIGATTTLRILATFIRFAGTHQSRTMS